MWSEVVSGGWSEVMSGRRSEVVSGRGRGGKRCG